MEVFHNEDDSYLRSVHSLVDKNAKDYLNSVYTVSYTHLGEGLTKNRRKNESQGNVNMYVVLKVQTFKWPSGSVG